MRGTLLALVALCLAPILPDQLYDDLTFVRNRPSPYTTVLEARAGLIGGFPDEEDSSVGLESNYGLDGYGYYRSEGFGSGSGLLQAYAGRDGAYLGLVNKELVGAQNLSRLELTYRYFPFYREGFYRSDNFVPTGQYEGEDWGASLSFGRSASEQLLVEGGLFYRSFSFDRNSQTALNYVVPEDYEAWGANLWLEHNTLVLDRDTGLPR